MPQGVQVYAPIVGYAFMAILFLTSFLTFLRLVDHVGVKPKHSQTYPEISQKPDNLRQHELVEIPAIMDGRNGNILWRHRPFAFADGKEKMERAASVAGF